MYTVAVKQNFIAQHFLVGGDWGEENSLHSHDYQLELQLHGDSLDFHGYLVDIVDIEKILQMVITHFSVRILNDLPEFSELNPSIENFSRILCFFVSAQIKAPNVQKIVIKLWEKDIAWAAYQMER